MTSRRSSEERFEAELRRAAQDLAREPLPRDVLDAEPVPRLGRAVPGFAQLAAAVVIIGVVLVIAASPGGFGGPNPPSASPVATPAPSAVPSRVALFRTTPEIRADLVTLGYACIVGPALASIGPGADAIVRQAAVCNAPADIGPLLAAVIVGESASGQVVEAHAKADIVGQDTAASRTAVATVLAKHAAIVVPAGHGTMVAAWVESNLPGLEKGGTVSVSIDGIALRLDRSSTGGYELEMTPAGV